MGRGVSLSLFALLAALLLVMVMFWLSQPARVVEVPVPVHVEKVVEVPVYYPVEKPVYIDRPCPPPPKPKVIVKPRLCRYAALLNEFELFLKEQGR